MSYTLNTKLFFIKDNIAIFERQAMGPNRQETERSKLNRLKQQKEEMDTMLLAAAQKILQQRLVSGYCSVKLTRVPFTSTVLYH